MKEFKFGDRIKYNGISVEESGAEVRNHDAHYKVIGQLRGCVLARFEGEGKEIALLRRRGCKLRRFKKKINST